LAETALQNLEKTKKQETCNGFFTISPLPEDKEKTPKGNKKA